MVAIIVTDAIRAALTAGRKQHLVRKCGNLETISHNSLASALRCTPGAPSLYSLMRDAEVHLSHADAARVHDPPQRNPQLEARVAKLRARQADAQYARMVRDVARTDASNAEVEDVRLSKLAPQASLGFNVVVTMATVFVACYFVFKSSSGRESVGLVAGIVGMIIAMAVEATLVITRLYSIDSAVSRQREKRIRNAEIKAARGIERNDGGKIE